MTGVVVTVVGANVRNCLAEARKTLGLALKVSREVARSGGEDGLYRVTLANGVVVECTVVAHADSESDGWMDPAGGWHHPDEEDPASQYK